MHDQDATVGLGHLLEVGDAEVFAAPNEFVQNETAWLASRISAALPTTAGSMPAPANGSFDTATPAPPR